MCYYGPQVLKDAGFGGDKKVDLLFSMICLAVLNALGNIICAAFSKKYGRKELILKYMIPMGISLLILTLTMVFNLFMGA